METVQYEDICGYKLLRFHQWLLQAIGIVPNYNYGAENKRWKTASKCFGIFMIFLMCLQGFATCLGAYSSIVEKDFAAVSNVLGYASVTLSSLSKYQIARAFSKEFTKLGSWAVKVKRNRGNTPIPIIEAIVHRVNVYFYISGVVASLVWAIVPFTRNMVPYIPSKFPYVDDEMANVISFPYVQIPTNLFILVTVVYVATSVLNLLAVFCTEVRLLAERWTHITYDTKCPQHYMNELKRCVNEHIYLLDVSEDLNSIHDSMFAFQVMIFIIHFCSFNFGLLKSGSQNAVFTLLPFALSSMLEFGLLCWMGQEITHAFQEFRKNIYMTNWYIAPIEERKSMILVMEILKKRRVLTGAKVFVASLDTFVEALRQAFSLYTIMKALTTQE